MKKEYSNGEVTVTWEPGKCIHSKRCWQGLLQVFNPQNKPWINMDGASTRRIVDQVKQCPSGALGFYMNDEVGPGSEDQQKMEDPSIEVKLQANGPILIRGNVLIKRPDGTEESRSGSTALCRCGGSSSKPFCDGTHNRINFSDE